jgi:FkbM family methyltransferase
VVQLHVPLTAADAAPGDGRRIVLEAPPAMFVPKRLAATGLAEYEPRAVECFLALTETAGPGSVLDIGANVGLYGLLAAAVGDRDVRAFEPTPDLAAVARAAAAANGLGVIVEELALGREAGTATFFLSDKSDSSNSLAEGYRQSSHQLDVTVETLDEYCARTGIVPALLKVDTETTEPDVLAGATRTIAEHRPWILCEVLPKRRTGELAEVMAPHGYTWYHLSDDEPQAVDRLDGDPTYAHLMYLFAPEPVDAAFWSRVRAWRQAVEAVQPAPAPAASATSEGSQTISLPDDQPKLASR